jgi:hypothetical protein
VFAIFYSHSDSSNRSSEHFRNTGFIKLTNTTIICPIPLISIALSHLDAENVKLPDRVPHVKLSAQTLRMDSICLSCFHEITILLLESKNTCKMDIHIFKPDLAVHEEMNATLIPLETLHVTVLNTHFTIFFLTIA